MSAFKSEKKTASFSNKPSRLAIDGLSLPVHLGYSSKERAVLQNVRFFIEVEFPTAPEGESTDSLEGVICYDEICSALRAYVKGRSFRLIEKMAKDCLSLLCKKYPSALIRLTLCKNVSSVEGLEGGVRYSCEGSRL